MGFEQHLNVPESSIDKPIDREVAMEEFNKIFSTDGDMLYFLDAAKGAAGHHGTEQTLVENGEKNTHALLNAVISFENKYGVDTGLKDDLRELRRHFASPGNHIEAGNRGREFVQKVRGMQERKFFGETQS